MKLKVYNLFILVFITFGSFAQYEITGRIKSSADSIPVKGCKVYLDEKYSTETDEKGNFKFSSLPGRTYFLQTTSPGYKTFSQQIKLKNKTAHLDILLESRTVLLEEVMVTDQKTDFGFTRMKGIESMGIYEGKKTEVIIPEQLVANLATNNARQVYSRVAGLNIWENDGGGLQLSIGGRGLDPNRTSNFNVRQNGHDISADALGYPESYYTPPIEAVGKIQIVRGAASLQYGTQFGGLINFVMKKPVTNRKLELVFRQSAGSFGFYNAFTSVSGTVGRLSYYTLLD